MIRSIIRGYLRVAIDRAPMLPGWRPVGQGRNQYKASSP